MARRWSPFGMFSARNEFEHFEDDFQALARMGPTGPQDLSAGLRMGFARCRYFPGKGAPEEHWP